MIKFQIDTRDKHTTVEPFRIVSNDPVVDPKDNPNRRKLYVINNVYGVCAVIWASHEEDALEDAADLGLLSGLKTDQPDPDATPLGSYGMTFDLNECGVRVIPHEFIHPNLISAFRALSVEGHDATLADLTLQDCAVFDITLTNAY